MKPRPIVLIALALVLWPAANGAAQATPPSARDQVQQIRGDLKRTHAANDAAGYLAAAEKNAQFLNGSPASLLQLMSAQGFAGDTDAALTTFAQFVQMGQASEDSLQLPQFEQLRKDPRFAALHAQMTANTSPVSQAIPAFSLKDPGLIPEDIDYDPATHLFYITSVVEKKILAIDSSGNAHTFAQAPDHWPIMSLKLDRSRHLLWATEVALDGFEAAPKEDWGRSAILVYDLATRKLLHRIEGPAKAALADMVLTAAGDAIVADGQGGGIYRIHRQSFSLERIDAGDFISPQTPAISPDGKTLFVPDYLRGIGILNLETKRVTWIPMNGAHALTGIDGLYLDGHNLIATQNGTSPERVVRFQLDPSFAAVTSEHLMERGTATLGDPTHGVIVDGWFYYIANSGWDTLDDHGHLLPNATPTPPLIMKAPLHN
jgi:sugar lactone lactonase YvrE